MRVLSLLVTCHLVFGWQTAEQQRAAAEANGRVHNQPLTGRQLTNSRDGKGMGGWQTAVQQRVVAKANDRVHNQPLTGRQPTNARDRGMGGWQTAKQQAAQQNAQEEEKQET